MFSLVQCSCELKNIQISGHGLESSGTISSNNSVLISTLFELGQGRYNSPQFGLAQIVNILFSLFI